jgi:hypothetical protein
MKSPQFIYIKINLVQLKYFLLNISMFIKKNSLTLYYLFIFKMFQQLLNKQFDMKILKKFKEKKRKKRSTINKI